MSSPKENWRRLAKVCQEYARFFDFFDKDKKGEWKWTQDPYGNILDLGMGLAMAAEMMVDAVLWDKGRDHLPNTHERLTDAILVALGKEMKNLCGKDILGWKPAEPKPGKKPRSPKSRNKGKGTAP